MSTLNLVHFIKSYVQGVNELSSNTKVNHQYIQVLYSLAQTTPINKLQRIHQYQRIELRTTGSRGNRVVCKVLANVISKRLARRARKTDVPAHRVRAKMFAGGVPV